jgi:hypothetical protein
MLKEVCKAEISFQLRLRAKEEEALAQKEVSSTFPSTDWIERRSMIQEYRKAILGMIFVGLLHRGSEDTGSTLYFI